MTELATLSRRHAWPACCTNVCESESDLVRARLAAQEAQLGATRKSLMAREPANCDYGPLLDVDLGGICERTWRGGLVAQGQDDCRKVESLSAIALREAWL
jgi:hypothetical protein